MPTDAPAAGACRRGSPVLLAVAAALVAAIAYANTLRGGFVWDDHILIVESRLPKSWSALPQIFTRDFFHRSEADAAYGYYRPLITVSYLADYSLWGLDPSGYHATNVLAHALCSALLVILLARRRWPPLAAAAAGILFAAHPIHTESVAWIAGRTDVLALLFSLLALTLDPHVAGGGRVATGRRLAAAGCFAAALLCKEIAVVVVAWAAALAWTDRGRGNAAWRASLPYVLVVTGYAAWRWGIIHVPGPAQPPDHTTMHVLLSAPVTLLRYLGWLAVPLWPSAYVQNPYVDSPADARFLLPLMGVAAVVALGTALARRDSRARDSLILLVLALLPLLNPARPAGPPDMGNMMAERFCYFPSAPWCALLGTLFWRWQLSSPRRWLPAAAAAAVLAVAVGATVARNRDWRDERTFLETTLRRSPRAAILWVRLAQRELADDRLDAARRALARAATLVPEAPPVLALRAELLVRQGRLAAAIPVQERVVSRTVRGRAIALNNLAHLYLQAGRQAEAEAILLSLLRSGHAYADVYANLAELRREEGRTEEAGRLYRSALADRPDDLGLAEAYASLLVEQGRTGAAIGVLKDQLRYHPDDARLLNNIGMLHASRGDLARAERWLERAIAAGPDRAAPHLNRAQVLARLGRHREAAAELRLAERHAGDPGVAAAVEQARAVLEEARAARHDPAGRRPPDAPPTAGGQGSSRTTSERSPSSRSR